MNKELRKIILTSLFIAVGYVITIPFRGIMLGGVPAGVIFSPMHIPVIIAGLLLGAKYGLIAGLITPLLTSLLSGMPALVPNALVMSLELATYGFVSGYLFHSQKRFKNEVVHTYSSLVISMIMGRVVYLLAMGLALLVGLTETYQLISYLKALFVIGLPAIIIQLVLIPPLVLIVKTRLRLSS